MFTGSDTFLIFPNAGDENFISVINGACCDLIITSSKSISDLDSDSDISYTPSLIDFFELLIIEHDPLFHLLV